MATNVGYFVRESFINFKRNWVMSLGAIITIFLSLLLVGVAIVISLLVSEVVKDVEEKVTVQVFLKDGVAEEDVLALQAFIDGDAMVRSVSYTSKEEALERFREQMAESPEILDQIEENPLPASLDIELNDPREVQAMVDKIRASELFLNVADRPDDPDQSLKYGQEIVEDLFAFTRVLRIVLAVFIAMLSVVSLIFINNTIRLAIYARRKEIGIMRLVGASNWFIRTPFLMEGMIQAMIGATMAIGFIIGLQALLLPKAREILPFLAVDLTGTTLVQLSLVLVGTGLLIGLLGSGLALRRYLRV